MNNQDRLYWWLLNNQHQMSSKEMQLERIAAFMLLSIRQTRKELCALKRKGLVSEEIVHSYKLYHAYTPNDIAERKLAKGSK